MTTITKAAAGKMWDELRGHLVNAEKCIAKIIDAKAWEPLGYTSFAEAWAARMQGVPLATDVMRAHVVYAMFDAGLDDAEVLDATGIGSQVGPRSVAALRRQKAAGVPPELASTRVKAHYRKKPGAPRTVHVELTEREYAAFREYAESQELDTASLAAQLIRAYIEQGMAA